MPTLIAQNWPQRRKEILLLTANGYTESETAKALGLAVQSVKNQRQAILCKLGSKNMCQAIAKAFELGILRYIPILALCFLTSFGSDSNILSKRRGPRLPAPIVWKLNVRAS